MKRQNQDSFVHVYLNIKTCDNYLSPSKRYKWTFSGNYKDTLLSYRNFDSILNIVLTISKTSINNQNISLCGGKSLNVGSNKYNISGIYRDTLTSHNGCDSIIISNLTILKTALKNQTIALCSGKSLTVGVHEYYTSGIYLDTLNAYNGCDSIVTSNLTINNAIDTSTSFSLSTRTITANLSSVTYQWVDCVTGLFIQGATNQSYKVTKNGQYAVILNVNSCSDTSSCINVNGLGTMYIYDSEIKIYPNPNKGQFQIELATGSQVIITDVLGRELYNQQLSAGIETVSMEGKQIGIYFITILNENYKIVRQITVNK